MNDFFSWTLFTYKNVRNMVTTKNLNSCCIYLYIHGHRHCLATVLRTFYWLSVSLISSAWQLVNNHRDRNLSDLLKFYFHFSFINNAKVICDRFETLFFMTMNSRLPTDTNDLENNENDSATHDADSKKLTSTIKLEDENIGSIRFYPPLFMQRYSFTAKVLEKNEVKWVSRSSYHGYICI